MWVAGGHLTILKSTDRGQTHTSFWNPHGVYGFGANNVVVLVSGRASTVYAGTWSGIFKTTDGATFEWNEGFGEDEVGTLVVSPADPETLYASGWYSTGVASSTNGGATWFRHNSLSPPIAQRW